MYAFTFIPRIRFHPSSHLHSVRFFFTAGDSYHYTRLLQSSTGPTSLKQIHAQIIITHHDANPFLATKLVSRYADLGVQGIENARNVFDRSSQRDIFLWNVMIRGYANSGPQGEAVVIYTQLRASSTPLNCYTHAFVIKACAALRDSRTGRTVHAHSVRAGLDSILFVSNALVAFYCKCGDLETARMVFDEMSLKDIVSWNSMIAGYGQNDRATEAIDLFHRMLRGDPLTGPDRVTLVALLPACTQLAAVAEGMWIHSRVVKTGMGADPVLGSGLIGIYGSCGRLETARQVFDGISEKNLVMCNSMIGAYGVHGRASEALGIFSRMLELGVAPDGICFVSVLSACSHAGMVDKGREIFDMMGGYGVEKGQIHYACMVDLLGRSGRLREAVEFIEEMPVESGRDVWGALLGACRIYNDVELAEEAAGRLFLLDPENAGRYLALAKIYEDVGRQEDAARVRKAMKDRGVRKPLGCSMVEADDGVHTFGVEDESHPMTDEIYIVLELLKQEVEEVLEDGYSIPICWHG